MNQTKKGGFLVMSRVVFGISLLRSFLSSSFFGLVFFSVQANANICFTYLHDQQLRAHEIAFEQFDFPEEGYFFIFERVLRIALHEAFEGLDYYTSLPLNYDQMSIDHIIPKALGGPNNVMNYVPTTGAINSKKGNKFGKDDLINLEAVRDIYGPRVLALLRHYGAFENREEDLAKAIIASRRRSSYRYDRDSKSSNINILQIGVDQPTVFRRSMDQPNPSVFELLSLFSKELSRLSEEDFAEVISKRSLQFDIETRTAPAIDMNEEMSYYLYLSYRKQGAKLIDDVLVLRSPLFEVVKYDVDLLKNKIYVNIKFHPMFALKLLEAPSGRLKTLDFLQALFHASDITKDEFMEWSNY